MLLTHEIALFASWSTRNSSNSCGAGYRGSSEWYIGDLVLLVSPICSGMIQCSNQQWIICPDRHAGVHIWFFFVVITFLSFFSPQSLIQPVFHFSVSGGWVSNASHWWNSIFNQSEWFLPHRLGSELDWVLGWILLLSTAQRGDSTIFCLWSCADVAWSSVSIRRDGHCINWIYSHNCIASQHWPRVGNTRSVQVSEPLAFVWDDVHSVIFATLVTSAGFGGALGLNACYLIRFVWSDTVLFLGGFLHTELFTRSALCLDCSGTSTQSICGEQALVFLSFLATQYQK